jgi:hypothetical protein
MVSWRHSVGFLYSLRALSMASEQAFARVSLEVEAGPAARVLLDVDT